MEWGTVPDWVAAVATALGFAAAVYQLNQSRKDQEAERNDEREAELARQRGYAASVGLKASWTEEKGKWSVQVVVKNASPYPISAAVVVIAHRDDGDSRDKEVVYGTVLPGEQLDDTYATNRTEVVFGELTGGVSLRFTDIFDRHWEAAPWGLEEREHMARIC